MKMCKKLATLMGPFLLIGLLAYPNVSISAPVVPTKLIAVANLPISHNLEKSSLNPNIYTKYARGAPRRVQDSTPQQGGSTMVRPSSGSGVTITRPTQNQPGTVLRTPRHGVSTDYRAPTPAGSVDVGGGRAGTQAGSIEGGGRAGTQAGSTEGGGRALNPAESIDTGGGRAINPAGSKEVPKGGGMKDTGGFKNTGGFKSESISKPSFMIKSEQHFYNQNMQFKGINLAMAEEGIAFGTMVAIYGDSSSSRGSGTTGPTTPPAPRGTESGSAPAKGDEGARDAVREQQRTFERASRIMQQTEETRSSTTGRVSQ